MGKQEQIDLLIKRAKSDVDLRHRIVDRVDELFAKGTNNYIVDGISTLSIVDSTATNDLIQVIINGIDELLEEKE